VSVTETEKLLQNIKKQHELFFPDTEFVVLERFPFYVKIRIIFEWNLFMEIRYNTKGKRWSYVLIRDGKRVAGFDNLSGWHMHPKENPLMHRKIASPTLEQVFRYFSHLVAER
jgi:hypothetical protein